MSIPIDEVLNWRGRTVVDRDGQKIGTFDEIYLDEGTSEPAWAAVKTGPFGFRRRVVPIAAAELNGDHIRVPFTKSEVKSAPSIDSEGWVAERDQAAILRHYGMGGGDSGVAAGPTPAATAPETPAPEESESPDATGKTEAGTGERPPDRVKLKRYTVTETLTRRSEFGPD
jgi:hypothetical protein